MEKKKKRKKLYLIAGVILVVVFVAEYFFVPYAKRHYVPVTVDVDEAAAMEKTDMGGQKVLTVYFTRVGNSDSYRAEAYKDLLDVVMRNRDNMEKQDWDKVGKILMGLYQLSKWEK